MDPSVRGPSTRQNARALRTYASAVQRLSSSVQEEALTQQDREWYHKLFSFRRKDDDVKLYNPLAQDYWYTNKDNWEMYTSGSSDSFWRLVWKDINRWFGRENERCVGGGSSNRRSCLWLPIMRPDNVFAMTWQVLMTVLDATYTAFLLPYIIAFGEGSDSLEWFKWLALITATIYLLDICIQFHSGFIIEWEGKTRAVMDGTLVARHYVFHGYFIFDVLSVVPIILGYIEAEQYTESTFTDNDYYKISDTQYFQLLRLVHLKRVYDVLRFSAQYTGSHHNNTLRLLFSVQALYIYMATYFFVLLLHLMGCVWAAIGFVTQVSHEENTWLRNAGVEDLSDAPKSDVYIASMYFIMTTITTIGYGDISAKNTPERLICLVLGPISVIVFGIVVNGIGEVIALARSNKDRSRLYRTQVAPLDEFFHLQSLDVDLLTDVKQYFSRHWVPATLVGQNMRFFNELPPILRSRVFLNIQHNLMHHFPGFNLLDAHYKMLLTSYMLFDCVEALNDVFTQGDAAHNLFFLEEGTVVISKCGRLQRQAHAPCWIGEPISLTGDSHSRIRHSVTARAKTTCQLWFVSVDRVRSLIGVDNPVFIHAVVDSMDFTADPCPSVEVDAEALPDRSHYAPEQFEVEMVDSSSALHGTLEQQPLI